MPTETRRFPDPTRVETKGSLVEALACAKTNFLIGYYFGASPIGPSHFLEPLPPSCTWPSLDKEYADMSALMKWRRDVELQLWENYRNGLVRALIKESYELVFHYCKASGQVAIFQEWSHFRLLRLLRNAMSHTTGGIIRWTYGAAVIEWRTYQYTPESDGRHIILTTEDAFDLHAELRQFVDHTLS